MTLPAVILSVAGVKDFDLLISRDGDNFSEDNIEVSTREKVVTDESRVSIT